MIGWPYRDADEAAEVPPDAPEPGGAAQDDHVTHGGHGRDIPVLSKLHLSVIVDEADRGERPRRDLRPELAVGAENDAPDSKTGGLELEARQTSHAASMLANVGPKQKLHGNTQAFITEAARRAQK